MKQTLNINLSTQIRMTPQLQHAIKLLQMSTLDLRQEIQENLENNPLLEVEENFLQTEASSPSIENQKEADSIVDLSLQADQMGNEPTDKALEENQVTEKLDNPLSEELPLDTTWEDTYQSVQQSIKEKSENLNNQEYLTNNSTEETLHDYLIWQLNLAPLAREDKIVGLTLIDSIDTNGFLTVELSELLETINIEEVSSEVSIDVLENILGVIQDFDPAGVGARNLTECLLLQLREIDVTKDLQKCCEFCKTFLHDFCVKCFFGIVKTN